MYGLIGLLCAVAIILVLYFGVFAGGGGEKGPDGTPLSGPGGESYMATTLKAPERARQVVEPASLKTFIDAYYIERDQYPPSLEALEQYVRETQHRGLPNPGSNMHYEYDARTGQLSIQPGAAPAPAPAGGPAPAPGPITPGGVRDMLKGTGAPPPE